MIDATFAIPGDLATPTGGYAYARRILPLLAAFGVRVTHLELPGSFPALTEADLAETQRLFEAVPARSVLLIDGLAYGAMPVSLVDKIQSPIVALVHHPLCLEAGLSQVRANALRASETAALRRARRIVTVSPAMARLLVAEFEVLEARIAVAVPGTEPATRSRGSGDPVRLLAVGAITPRKGYDVLIEALAVLGRADWRLTIAGALDRDRDAVEALMEQIAAADLNARVNLAGNKTSEDLDALYACADILVMPSLFEGYGMVLAEAMARGLPIVCTTGGAAAETVPDDAALKAPPGDPAALAAALARIIDDPGLRARSSDASWAAGQRLPRWEHTAGQVATAIREAVA